MTSYTNITQWQTPTCVYVLSYFHPFHFTISPKWNQWRIYPNTYFTQTMSLFSREQKYLKKNTVSLSYKWKSILYISFKMKHCAVENNIEVRHASRRDRRIMFSIIHIYFYRIHFFLKHFHLTLAVARHYTLYKGKGLIGNWSQLTELWRSENINWCGVAVVFSGVLLSKCDVLDN
jgi:hypothetical protein